MSDMLSKLHDATLLSVYLDWPKGQCEFRFAGGPSFPEEFSLVWDEVHALNVPRGNAWGESVSVLGAKQVGNRFEFEMQSGDVIAVEAPNYSLKRTAADELR